MKSINLIFYSYNLYFRGFLLYILKKNKKHKLICAIDTLINQFSFRTPKNISLFYLFFKVVKDSFKKIWASNNNAFSNHYNSSSQTAIFNENVNLETKIKEDYVEEILNTQVKLVIYNSKITYIGNFYTKALFSLIFLFGLIPLLITTLFVKNKKSVFFSYYELVESISVVDYLVKSNINSVYSFFAYDKASNFLALLLNSNSILLHKICSPNPIKVHYQKVIADTFIFTAPFQKEEYIDLKHNWFINETRLWPVPEFKKYKQKYFNKRLNTPKNVIGFYSSAFERRKDLGHNNLDARFYNSEIKLLELLKLFLIKNESVSLKIYLHPLEKVNDIVFQNSIIHYKNKFSRIDDRLFFSEKEIETSLDFNAVNTAISVTSTVNFERIYCGFKALYAPLCFKNGFFEGTQLNNVSINNEEFFFDFLAKNIAMSEQEFFEKNNISDYIFY